MVATPFALATFNSAGAAACVSVVRTAPVLIADVMQTSAHVAQAAHVRVRQDVNHLVATRAAVKLPPNQVAVKKVNALLIKNKSDHRF